MVPIPRLGGRLDWCTAVASDDGLCCLGSIFGLRCVVRVQLLDVKTATTLMHVDSANGTFNLNILGSVPFLRIQLSVSPHVGRINKHHAVVFGTEMSSIVRGVHKCLPSWIESETCLVQLIIKGRIHNLVIVLTNALPV